MIEYKKLNNQPLQIVLLEVRFSTVMDIAKYIPAFQDKIRKEYPISGEPLVDQSVHINGQNIEVRNSQQWAFVSKNRKSAVTLADSRFVYFTAEYPRFEGFSKQVESALQVVSEVISPSLISRIGMRFCDLVKPTKDENIEQLISKDLLYDKVLDRCGKVATHTTETILQNDFGILLIKTMTGINKAVLPPDFGRLPVVIEEDKESSIRTILDFDHYWHDDTNQMDFDIYAVKQKMEEMHNPLREAFWNVTTDYARNEKWN
jgi:uncharacterized protein (TIGR04255 family)